MVNKEERITIFVIGIMIGIFLMLIFQYVIMNDSSQKKGRVERVEFILDNFDNILDNPYYTIPQEQPIGDFPGIWGRIKNGTNGRRAEVVLYHALNYVCDDVYMGNWFVEIALK